MAKLLVCAIPLILAALVLALFPLVSNLWDELGRSATSGNVRLNLTLNGLAVLWETRGVGTGPGTLESELYGFVGAQPTDGQVNAHNAWVEFLVQYGIIPFATFATWLWLLVRRTSTSGNPLRLAVVALVPLAVLDSSLIADPQFALALLTIGLLGFRTRVREFDPPRSSQVQHAPS